MAKVPYPTARGSFQLGGKKRGLGCWVATRCHPDPLRLIMHSSTHMTVIHPAKGFREIRYIHGRGSLRSSQSWARVRVRVGLGLAFLPEYVVYSESRKDLMLYRGHTCEYGGQSAVGPSQMSQTGPLQAPTEYSAASPTKYTLTPRNSHGESFTLTPALAANVQTHRWAANCRVTGFA